ncbi:MAG: hypothetical protein L0Y44_11125 [Phycisphaerales bacterium]|nr:hypothetical protein [Phycisphaerales bacterium]MCI0676416.1 hypothetical protein [Phycisphaerales bacterium]
MLHDAVMSRIGGSRKPGFRNPGRSQDVSAGQSAACLERRESDRLPFPAEIILVWNYDLYTPMRYTVIDAGDGGYRIHSSLPVLEGTTGMVLRLLPSFGQSLDQPVMVVWSRASQQSGGFDIGLRCF